MQTLFMPYSLGAKLCFFNIFAKNINNYFMSKISICRNISELQAHLPQDRKIFAIIDNNLKDYYRFFNNCYIIETPTGEKLKTLTTVEALTDRLLEAGADRSSFILGIGGGITSDLTGFLASVYKRGVDFAFVPTTLLSMCDAAIGGKNGVNFHGLKNMLGVIREPSAVIICPEFLRSLSIRQFRSGSAEVLKTFMIYDETYYRKAVDLFSRIASEGLEGKADELVDIIGKCASYKQAVVARDLNEHGERRLLNLGHSFAHAIESCGLSSEDNTVLAASGQLSHGEAVAIGLALAARAAAILHEAEPELEQQIRKDLRSCGLPDSIEGLNLDESELCSAMLKDKKVEGDSIHLILPRRIGEVIDLLYPVSQLASLWKI